MSETFIQWWKGLENSESFNDAGRFSCAEAAWHARDDEIREKDERIQELENKLEVVWEHLCIDCKNTISIIEDYPEAQKVSKIAKLEKVVEAAWTICDATYVHEMVNAATDIRNALKELEGV